MIPLRHAFAGLLLLIGACANTDVREEHLIYCTAYTSALEQIADNRNLGIYSQTQLDDIRRIELQTTPICLGPPAPNANALALQAFRQLNTYLLMRETQ